MDDQYLNLSIDLNQRLSKLFPTHITKTPNNSNAVSELDYQWFIEIRHEVLNLGQHNKDNWEQLLSKQTNFNAYSPYYELLGYLAIKLYDDTKNTQYLSTLNNKLRIAESYLGPSISIFDNDLYIALRKFDYKQAAEIINKIETLGADTTSILKRKASLANHEGNYQEAEALYQRALQLRPSVALWYGSALNQWSAGNTEKALNSLYQLFKLDSEANLANALLALIYLTTGDLDKAILQYKKVIRINPTAQHHSNLGLAYELQGDFIAAKKYFYEALKLSPENPNIWLNVADSHTLNNEQTAAKKYYLKIIEASENKKDWDSALNLSQAHIHLGNTSAALNAVHNSLLSAGENPEVLFNAALVYSVAEQWATAIVYIEKSLNADLNPVWFNLPWFDGLCATKYSEVKILLSEERCTVN